MIVTMNILSDLLDCELERGHVEGNPGFERLELFEPGRGARDGAALYVGLLSDVLGCERGGERLHFLCVRDRMVDERETDTAMDGVAIVRQNCRLHELFNTVQRIFSRVQQWQYALQSSVAHNHSVQSLLDLSEELLGNHIDVMDSTYKLLAHTENISVDDPVANELDRMGFHPRSTIDRLKKYRRFEQFGTENDIIVSTDCLISNVPTVKKVFHRRGSYFLIVVMVCSNRFTPGILDLFRILVDSMEYFTREHSLSAEAPPAASFVEDVLSGKLGSAAEVRERAAGVGLPFYGEYNLFLFRFSDTGNFPFSRIVMQMSTALPNAHIFEYRQSIIVLNQSMRYDNNRSAGMERLEQIRSALGGTRCSAGVSNSFRALDELPLAYDQAAAAIRLGEYLDRSGPQDGMAGYFFEDYSLHYTCYASMQFEPGLTANSMSARVIDILREHEKRYHTQYLEILYTYLSCECRASLAAERLNMHRNTVMYHVSRMEELLGLSFDDAETRLKILIGYKLNELKDFCLSADEFCTAPVRNSLS